MNSIDWPDIKELLKNIFIMCGSISITDLFYQLLPLFLSNLAVVTHILGPSHHTDIGASNYRVFRKHGSIGGPCQREITDL